MGRTENGMTVETKPAQGERPDAGAMRRPLRHAAGAIVLPFWRTRASLRSYMFAVLLLAIMLAELRVALWSSEALGDLSGALVDRRATLVAGLMWMCLWLSIGEAINTALSGYLRRFVMIDWRRWLNARYQAAWLMRGNFHRIEREGSVDNPDQRIGDDLLILVDLSTALATRTLRDVLRLVGFASMLFGLGAGMDLRSVGIPLVLPGGLFLLAITLAAINTMLAFAIGRPLISLRVAQQRKDADLRYALANMRLNAEQIAFYGGEEAERQRIAALLAPIVGNWHRIMRYTVRLTGFNGAHQFLIMLTSTLAGLPRYLAGQVDYAHLMMTGSAFMMTLNGLSGILILVVNGLYANWASAVRRLDVFAIELERPETSGIALRLGSREDGALLATHGLSLERPDGSPLGTPGDLVFHAGERWLVRGPSGVGKSTMMRAIAGLWQHGSGEVDFDPAARARTLFLPQKSYVPAGSLVDALTYPALPGRFTADQCAAALRLVRLDAFAGRLDEDRAWQETLSPGEQQRIAFARAFLHEPAVLLLDEATSSLDPDNERHLYAMLDARLPDTLVISIAHREALDAFHQHTLRLGVDEDA